MTIELGNGLVTFDSDPHGPVTARVWYPVPSVNRQSGSELQLLWGASDSIAGSMSEATVL